VAPAVRDIGDRVRAEQVNRETLAMLDATDDAVFMCDPNTLRLCYANEGAVRMCGYAREELGSMTPLATLLDLDQAGLRAMLDPVREGAAHARRHKDGHTITIDISPRFMAPSGGAARFIAVTRDWSEHQRVLEELRRATEALSNLFMVFSQAEVSTTRRYGDAGLGLAISGRLDIPKRRGSRDLGRGHSRSRASAGPRHRARPRRHAPDKHRAQAPLPRRGAVRTHANAHRARAESRTTTTPWSG
jgi:PAS domain S-box-containing protein